MAGWLLAISRDPELTRSLSRLLNRHGGRDQLWTVDCPAQARQGLRDRESLPSTILIDEQLLREEPLAEVAEEFTWYAPVVLVARPDQQARVASLVAEGNVDFVPRGDYYIPLATALIDRNLRWNRELEKQCDQGQVFPAAPDGSDTDEFPKSDLPQEALRMIGMIISNLEMTLRERSHLPPAVSRRLERMTDLAFDLKDGLRLLASGPDRVDPAEAGTGTPKPR